MSIYNCSYDFRIGYNWSDADLCYIPTVTNLMFRRNRTFRMVAFTDKDGNSLYWKYLSHQNYWETGIKARCSKCHY